jgi:hypothetical protein
MRRTIYLVLPLAGLVACNGGGGSQTGDTGESTDCGTEVTGHAGTTGVSTEGSSSHDASSDESEGGSTDASVGTDDATTEGSSDAGEHRCGDDTCDADEDEGSCCIDCGCADGSSCVDAACTPDPFCGDAACNGAETQDDCCDDCGCAEGSACQEGACVVLPVCGDGTCNGAETQDDCCDDCGCGETYTCEANACSCTDAYLRFDNAMDDMDQFCFATNSFYTQESVAYFNDNLGTGWVYLADDGFIDIPGPLGTSIDGTTQCCLLDPCGGDQSCPTPGGNYPCFCADPIATSGSIDVCGENLVPLCG